MSHHSGHCSRNWHDPESAPYAHNRHQHPKTLLLLLLLCRDCVLEAFARSMPGQFRSIRAVSGGVVVLGCHRLGFEAPQSPPSTALNPLPVNHPWGACLPQRESRWGVSGGFGIHGASLGSPEPLAASPLPQGKRKRGRNEVFLGQAHDGASCFRRSRAGWACGIGSGVGTAARPASDPGAHTLTHRSQNHLAPILFLGLPSLAALSKLLGVTRSQEMVRKHGPEK